MKPLLNNKVGVVVQHFFNVVIKAPRILALFLIRETFI